jgi:preprotein translocase subunit SecG
MTTFLSIIHVFVCMFLILVVLLQQGRGGGLGGAFGGTSQQVFGGRGAGNFMTRLTWGCAIVFILTSVSLAYIASSGDRSLKARQGQSSGQKP